MKILIVTEKFGRGEDTFGYLHGHVIDAARLYDGVSVICLEKRECAVPQNVHVYSLGKDQGRKGRISYLMRYWKLLISLRREYDAVLIYLTPIYALAGSPVWKILGKKTVLWYNHKKGGSALRCAASIVNAVVAPSAEKCPLPSKKDGACRTLSSGFDISAVFSLSGLPGITTR